MDRKTKTSKIIVHKTPYEKYRGTALWEAVNNAVEKLVENNDIMEETRRDYIVGFICKELEEALPKPGSPGTDGGNEPPK